jgi:hypothetical protein
VEFAMGRYIGLSERLTDLLAQRASAACGAEV